MITTVSHIYEAAKKKTISKKLKFFNNNNKNQDINVPRCTNKSLHSSCSNCNINLTEMLPNQPSGLCTSSARTVDCLLYRYQSIATVNIRFKCMIFHD
jgi:hypothetical protein